MLRERNELNAIRRYLEVFYLMFFLLDTFFLGFYLTIISPKVAGGKVSPSIFKNYPMVNTHSISTNSSFFQNGWALCSKKITSKSFCYFFSLWGFSRFYQFHHIYPQKRKKELWKIVQFTVTNCNHFFETFMRQ